ncbi:hypothetical protein M885DRAFT_564031 [Pelagophyceae sp. CCMP2097]|nr:hypothetical protein M885DRAFT_564031 [Pelagophyceae sp. CCMP2097]
MNIIHLRVCGHPIVLLVNLLSFAALAMFLGGQHSQLARSGAGEDRFTAAGRDLIDARYWGVNHDGPWDAREFEEWFSSYDEADKDEYERHNAVAWVNYVQVICIFVGVLSNIVPADSPGWWVVLLPPPLIFVKVVDAAAIAALMAHSRGRFDLGAGVKGFGLVGGWCTALKIWGQLLNLFLVLIAVPFEAMRHLPRNTVGERRALIISSFGFAAFAAAAQLAFDHRGDSEARAAGPLVPLSCVWYVVSTMLCANAVYLYPKRVPAFIRVLCVLGLQLGCLDAVVEAKTWYDGDDQAFGAHWTGRGDVPKALQACALMGIACVVFEFVYLEDAALHVKVGAVLALAGGACFEFSVMPGLGVSSVLWHLGKTYVTHNTVVMLPALIVWRYAPQIDLFSQCPAFLPWRAGEGAGDARMIALCSLTYAVSAAAAACQLGYEHRGETQLASGPIIPLSGIWYLISNLLCANAAFLYPKYVPVPVKVVCWLGLVGGGIDHCVEVFTWFAGRPTAFGAHWMGGLEIVPLLCFAATSIVGIWSVVIEWLVRDDSAPKWAKVLVVAALLSCTYYEVAVSFSLGESSVNWHLGHMFITHHFLSMMPPMILFEHETAQATYAPELDLFDLTRVRAEWSVGAPKAPADAKTGAVGRVRAVWDNSAAKAPADGAKADGAKAAKRKPKAH